MGHSKLTHFQSIGELHSQLLVVTAQLCYLLLILLNAVLRVFLVSFPVPLFEGEGRRRDKYIETRYGIVWLQSTNLKGLAFASVHQFLPGAEQPFSPRCSWHGNAIFRPINLLISDVFTKRGPCSKSGTKGECKGFVRGKLVIGSRSVCAERKGELR